MNITTDVLEDIAAPQRPASTSTPEPPQAPRPKPAPATALSPESIRTHLHRFVRPVLVVLAVAAGVAATALAASPVASIAGKPVAINPKTKTFAISVTCISESDPCAGVLDVKTARKIKPYSSSPAAIAKVGTYPFSIPAGETSAVKGRVYGPALAEAMLRGKVQLSVVARLGTPAAAGSRLVLFTYKR
jgi:hypothetical protein